MLILTVQLPCKHVSEQVNFQIVLDFLFLPGSGGRVEPCGWSMLKIF